MSREGFPGPLAEPPGDFPSGRGLCKKREEATVSRNPLGDLCWIAVRVKGGSIRLVDASNRSPGPIRLPARDLYTGDGRVEKP